ncbi:hypothetical protein PCE1_002153 [Barthelona sp. PCE]
MKQNGTKALFKRIVNTCFYSGKVKLSTKVISHLNKKYEQEFRARANFIEEDAMLDALTAIFENTKKRVQVKSRCMDAITVTQLYVELRGYVMQYKHSEAMVNAFKVANDNRIVEILSDFYHTQLYNKIMASYRLLKRELMHIGTSKSIDYVLSGSITITKKSETFSDVESEIDDVSSSSSDGEHAYVDE